MTSCRYPASQSTALEARLERVQYRRLHNGAFGAGTGQLLSPDFPTSKTWLGIPAAGKPAVEMAEEDIQKIL